AAAVGRGAGAVHHRIDQREIVAVEIDAARPGRARTGDGVENGDAVDGDAVDDRLRPAGAGACDAVIGALDGHVLVDGEVLVERARQGDDPEAVGGHV